MVLFKKIIFERDCCCFDVVHHPPELPDRTVLFCREIRDVKDDFGVGYRDILKGLDGCELQLAVKTGTVDRWDYVWQRTGG